MTVYFARYLMATSAFGGAVGLAHGFAAFPPGVPDRTIHIYYNALSGAVMGPWFPVVVPVYAARWWPQGKDCPWLRRTPKAPLEMPTVAEKP